MQEELTSLVYSILQHGLELKSRLLRGEALILENEQAILKKMLLSETESHRWPDYGGDAGGSPGGFDARGRTAGLKREAFLGIRYALVCWLDELFLVDSPWEERWNENKLELALYGTNDRAWNFWEQGRVAEGRPGTDSLSAFFHCVMLGFRGEMREHPDQLQGWLESCRRRLLQSDSLQWVRPPELTPQTKVPPLRGRDSLRQMVVSGGALMLVLIPILAIFLVVLFMQPRENPLRAGKAPAVDTPGKSGAFPEETP
jgi:type VI secretion system protein ImpK